MPILTTFERMEMIFGEHFVFGKNKMSFDFLELNLILHSADKGGHEHFRLLPVTTGHYQTTTSVTYIN